MCLQEWNWVKFWWPTCIFRNISWIESVVHLFFPKILRVGRGGSPILTSQCFFLCEYTCYRQPRTGFLDWGQHKWRSFQQLLKWKVSFLHQRLLVLSNESQTERTFLFSTRWRNAAKNSVWKLWRKNKHCSQLERVVLLFEEYGPSLLGWGVWLQRCDGWARLVSTFFLVNHQLLNFQRTCVVRVLTLCWSIANTRAPITSLSPTICVSPNTLGPVKEVRGHHKTQKCTPVVQEAGPEGRSSTSIWVVTLPHLLHHTTNMDEWKITCSRNLFLLLTACVTRVKRRQGSGRG